jgi:beta-lactamase class A
MVESFRKIATDKTLDRPQRDLLTTWLLNTRTRAARIHSSIPNGWMVGNKTGTGGRYGSTDDLAIVWPPNHGPILIGIYYTSDNEKATKREDILSVATKVIIEEFIVRDKKLKS